MGLEMEMYTDTRIEEDVRRALGLWCIKKLERTQILSSLLHFFNYFWALRIMQTVLADIVASN